MDGERGRRHEGGLIDPLQVKVEHPAHLDQETLDAVQSRGDRPDTVATTRGNLTLVLFSMGIGSYNTRKRT